MAHRTRGEHLRLVLVDALRVQALVLIARSRLAEAATVLDEGLTLARSMPYPYMEARLLEVDGQLCARKGKPEQARERLAAALAIFRRLGARKDIERARQVPPSLD